MAWRDIGVLKWVYVGNFEITSVQSLNPVLDSLITVSLTKLYDFKYLWFQRYPEDH